MISCSHWGMYEGLDMAIAEFQAEWIKGYDDWYRRRRPKETSFGEGYREWAAMPDGLETYRMLKYIRDILYGRTATRLSK